MKINDLIKKSLKNPGFAKEYEIEGEKLENAVALYKAREEAGLTQAELAEKAHTTQATIARIERGDNVSMDKLSSIAHAMGKNLEVRIS